MIVINIGKILNACVLLRFKHKYVHKSTLIRYIYTAQHLSKRDGFRLIHMYLLINITVYFFTMINSCLYPDHQTMLQSLQS